MDRGYIFEVEVSPPITGEEGMEMLRHAISEQGHLRWPAGLQAKSRGPFERFAAYPILTLRCGLSRLLRM
jgi:hypothetical protein